MSWQRREEQKRAQSAWASVAEAKAKKMGDKYKSLAQKMPAYILTNGLGQTLAFLKAKAGSNPSDEHGLLYDHLSGWIRPQTEAKSNPPLLQWLMEGDSRVYRRATTEALAYLTWLKRFAEAELGD